MSNHVEPNTWQAWVAAARPRTLAAAVGPVLVGSALAWRDGGFHPGFALAALLGALLIQIGTNLANDYFDFKKGADTSERLGPIRVTTAGLLPPGRVRTAIFLTFGAAVGVGAFLVWRGGWPLAVIGVLSIASGILYTAGPVALAYVGLGDIFVLVFFGVVAVSGTHYVQTLSWSPMAAVAGLGPGLLSVAILAVNNLRDRAGDARVGKRTLAVRFGSGFARTEYTFCLVGACLVPMALFFAEWAGPSLAVVSTVGLVAGWPLLREAWQLPEGRELNALLGRTGRMLWMYSVAFAFFLVVDALRG